MTLYWVAGQVVDDQQSYVPPGSMPVSTFRNQAQYGDASFAWDPQRRYFSGTDIKTSAPGYLTELLGRLERQRRGEQLPWYEAEELAQWEATARAMPTRDIASLRAGWQGDYGGPEWWSLLDPGSPDAGPIMLQLRDKVMHGQATPQEKQLFQEVAAMAANWDYRASVPQESDANPFGLGDNLMGALMMLATGASGGAAAAALATSGLTLASISGLAATAGSITNLLSEPLDSAALKKAGLVLSLAGGTTSLASLLSNGINSVGDVVKAIQKVYGTSTKAMNLIKAVQQAGNDPGALKSALQTSQQSRTVSSNTQASTAADGSTPGGNTMADLDIGTVLAGLVGGVGSGLSLADVSRYMSQLKQRYEGQQETQAMIDEAYRLAVARYEMYYARTETEYQQKQEAYTQAQERYQTRYDQQQDVWDKQNKQFEKIEAQTDQDRATQYDNYQTNRQKVDESYNRQVQEAKEERDYQVARDSANVAKYDAAFARQVQEAQQDRAYEYQKFDEQYTKYQQNFDKRDAQAVEERGLDLNAYQQRQQVGRNLTDPDAIKAGAEKIYRPLSDAARERISTSAQEEMARRGVAEGGQFANLMSAKAYAPYENQLWETALNAYLRGQEGGLNAYTQQDMTLSPEYRIQNVPDFARSPDYRAITAPNLEGSPEYRPYNTPTFDKSSQQTVPTAPRYDQAPGVPEVRSVTEAPNVPTGNDPAPYAPFGTDPKTGQAATNDLASLVKNLTKAGLPQWLLKQVSGLLGGDTQTYDVPDNFAPFYPDYYTPDMSTDELNNLWTYDYS